MNNSVFSITNIGKSVLGTGFIIDNDSDGSFIATCGHVVNSCGDSILVSGKECTVISNNYDIGIDLAVLYVRGLHQNPLSVVPNKKATKGKVIGFTKLKNDPKRETINNIPLKTDVLIEKNDILRIEFIKLSPSEPINKGYSGAPVICEDSNMVIGIVNIQLGLETNYAICSEHLLNLYPSIGGSSDVIKKNNYKKHKIESLLNESDRSLIGHKIEESLSKSIESFSTQVPVWVPPQIYSIDETTQVSSHDQFKVDIDSIVSQPRNIEIYSRHQYGSTCLAHHLVKKAWDSPEPSIWLYVDINQLKPFPKTIKKVVERQLKKLNVIIQDLECIVVDELTENTINAEGILNHLFDLYKDIPVVLMRKTGGNPLTDNTTVLNINRGFEKLFLWALPRYVIRELVSQYNKEEYIENENRVVNKIISDLEVINIPRTPQNCLTLLKISEANFDDSPVNRSEMIHRILSLLFNFDHIPNYKRKPDLTDTEHILGFFCEGIVRTKSYVFSKIDFDNQLKNYCRANEIDVDVEVIFDVLFNNNVIIGQDEKFHFKFSFWVFYFAAHRMLHNQEFSQFVMMDCNYLDYPELIEFYSGIDRRRDDLIKVLKDDLVDITNIVIKKCSLPTNFNVLDYAKWVPSEESIREVNEQVANGVLNSNLPDEIKDNYADNEYSRTKPLSQGIGSILADYSVLRMMKCITSCSKVLRNSSYANVKLKHEILDQIILSWNELSKVLISIAPILNQYGKATVEGASFRLLGYFGETEEERLKTIIQLAPSNINKWFCNDIYSGKLGTMLIKRAESEDNQMDKHLLNLLIITKRPEGWARYIEEYIHTTDKNSFYLMDLFHNIRGEYQYSFASGSSLKQMKELIKKSLAKHIFGNEKKIGKIKDSNLPVRNEKKL
jgi:hypothetical protein